MAKDPYKLKGFPTLGTMKRALHNKQPYLGVTQGGSSRKGPGARVAATKGLYKPKGEK